MKSGQMFARFYLAGHIDHVFYNRSKSNYGLIHINAAFPAQA
jgi:hypothetical protein